MFPISEKTIQKLIIKGKRLIDTHSIVFFDVFDTLLTRDCAHPSNVFELVEKTYNKQEKTCPVHDFYNLRKTAEKKCAQNVFAPNLDEIYDCLSLDSEMKSRLKTIEIETELKLSIKKYTGYALYCYAKEQRKRVVAVSDMYLGADIISKMLISAGYDVDNVIVSCDNRAEKFNGKLFQLAIKKLSATKKNIIHFGDNPVSDIIGAMRAGIDCLWIPAKKNLSYFKKSGDSFADNYLLPFVANRVPLIENKTTALGYETCGPMIVGFCQWLHQKLHDGHFNKALFCARDMLQTYQIYLEMYPEDKDLACYFYASRKSLQPAYDAVLRKDTSSESLMQLDNLRDYINQLDCKGKVAYIDSGLNGRSQKMLISILKGKIELHGLYMRIAKDFSSNVNDFGTHVYMYPNNPEIRHTIAASFFETMIAAVHGRTTKYVRNSYGKIDPVLGKGYPDFQTINDFQQGVVQFALNYKKSCFNRMIIGERAVRNALLRLAFFPKDEDVMTLGGLKCGEEKYDERIIIRKDKQHYFLHPMDFFWDLKNTCWKGGFLRYCFMCFSPVISRLYLRTDCFFLNWFGEWNNVHESE